MLVRFRERPDEVVVRDAARAPRLPGGDVALATYDDDAALRRALHPGDRVFMVSMHAPYDERVALHQAFIKTAAEIGVARIVYLSFVGAGPEASFLHARSHGATEALLAASGVPSTAVRNGMYADEIASWFDPDGRITGPGGDDRVTRFYNRACSPP